MVCLEYLLLFGLQEGFESCFVFVKRAPGFENDLVCLCVCVCVFFVVSRGMFISLVMNSWSHCFDCFLVWHFQNQNHDDCLTGSQGGRRRLHCLPVPIQVSSVGGNNTLTSFYRPSRYVMLVLEANPNLGSSGAGELLFFVLKSLSFGLVCVVFNTVSL